MSSDLLITRVGYRTVTFAEDLSVCLSSVVFDVSSRYPHTHVYIYPPLHRVIYQFFPPAYRMQDVYYNNR